MFLSYCNLFPHFVFRSKQITNEVAVSSSNRPSVSSCVNLEPQPETSSQPQHEASLEPQPVTSSEPQPGTSLEPPPSYFEDIEEEDVNIFLDLESEDDIYCTENEEKRCSTEKKKLTKRTANKSKTKGVKKSYKKKFVLDWLKQPEFKEWLLKGNGENNAICKVCNVVMKAGKSELKKHSAGKIHSITASQIKIWSLQHFPTETNRALEHLFPKP